MHIRGSCCQGAITTGGRCLHLSQTTYVSSDLIPWDCHSWYSLSWLQISPPLRNAKIHCRAHNIPSVHHILTQIFPQILPLWHPSLCVFIGRGYVFLLLSMYSYCCLCILIVVYVFLLLSMYSYCCLCIVIVIYVLLLLYMYSYFCPCILIVVYVFLLLSMYSYCCLCILIFVYVFLLLSIYSYCCLCILIFSLCILIVVYVLSMYS